MALSGEKKKEYNALQYQKKKEEERLRKQLEQQDRQQERDLVSGKRYKTWTLIFYPDSAPEDWREYLYSMNRKIWVSPLHDMDVYSAVDELRNADRVKGSRKKPHYHLIVQYDVPQSRDTVSSHFSFLNGPEYFCAVHSLYSMIRYMWHLDDPNKFRYPITDYLCFGGADVDIAFRPTQAERIDAIKDMQKFIKNNRITSFAEFSLLCQDEYPEWFSLICTSCTYVIKEFIKSYAHEIKTTEYEVRKRKVNSIRQELEDRMDGRWASESQAHAVTGRAAWNEAAVTRPAPCDDMPPNEKLPWDAGCIEDPYED